jgi:hypothetical protein
MRAYTPEGLDQIPPQLETPWLSDPTEQLTRVPELNIDRSSYRYVNQGSLYTFQPHIEVAGSEGFVNCSAHIIRNRTTDETIFAHYWPGETDDTLYDYLKRSADQQKDIVTVFGSSSRPTGFEVDFARDRFVNVRARAISIETGNTWWNAVFNRMTGDLVILRRKPTQSIVSYQLFNS